MRLDVVRLRKRFTAYSTLLGLIMDACVMHLEIARQRERLTAHIALVLVLFVGGSDVVIERAKPPERLTAYSTFVGIVLVVDGCGMLLEIATVGKDMTAYSTFMSIFNNAVGFKPNVISVTSASSFLKRLLWRKHELVITSKMHLGAGYLEARRVRLRSMVPFKVPTRY